jgi:hypothetical protein
MEALPVLSTICSPSGSRPSAAEKSLDDREVVLHSTVVILPRPAILLSPSIPESRVRMIPPNRVWVRIVIQS